MKTFDPDFLPDLDQYNKIIVAFSGGKDSISSFLWLLDLGADKDRIELWHQDIDGREGSSLMDWPCTPDYCRAFAKAFDVPIFFQWKVGGFEREMLRDNQPTAPTKFETPEGLQVAGGTSGKCGTRCKFPQVSGDLRVRWCSAYLKIDPCALAIRNQDRFNHSKTLVVSGERAQESSNRAKYPTFETDRSDARNGRFQRHVDRWRPVHSWDETEVWEIIKQHRVNPHPAYRLGWGRLSCMLCIFGSKNQWASANVVNPEGVKKVSDYEVSFEHTIQRNKSVPELVASGTPYDMDQATIQAAMSKTFDEAIILEPGTWTLPAGAFGESCGPT